jgi:hypothetical protein
LNRIDFRLSETDAPLKIPGATISSIRIESFVVEFAIATGHGTLSIGEMQKIIVSKAGDGSLVGDAAPLAARSCSPRVDVW